MDIKQITQLAEMFKNSKLQEIKFSDSKTKISINKAPTFHPPTHIPYPLSHTPIPQPPTPTPQPLHSLTPNPQSLTPTNPTKEILSEGVGIFYPTIEQRAIDAKTRVVKGSDAYFVRAMNLENHKKLDFDCKIIKYLVEPGKAVEYGQPLVLVEVL